MKLRINFSVLVIVVCLFLSSIVSLCNAGSNLVLSSEEDWYEVLEYAEPNSNSVIPVDTATWDWYINIWEDPESIKDGIYPPELGDFYEPWLAVIPEPDTSPCCSEGAGLIMAWGDTEIAGLQSSAWRFQYGQDPDLSNSIIRLSVYASEGITEVSFGIIDANGNRCCWYWTIGIGGAIEVDISENIVIDMTDIPYGLTTPSPDASGFAMDPGFDPTIAIDYFFDETFDSESVSEGTEPIPLPNYSMGWNAWYDVVVSEIEDEPVADIMKWQQPVSRMEDNLILGWGNTSTLKSFYGQTPQLMADDWFCCSNRPMTDIHWWGDYTSGDGQGWQKDYTPNDYNDIIAGFWFGMWTDVAKDPYTAASSENFSMPGELIWEHYCDIGAIEIEFAGYNIDPRVHQEDIYEGCFDYNVTGSCFKYSCYLPEDNYFPENRGNCGQVYWLSIAPIYQYPDYVNYRWGWKSRVHHYNDNAVAIHETDTWPYLQDWPMFGDNYINGAPLSYPKYIPWDLAFELSTNKECEELFESDINGDGKVDLDDLAIFCSQWLAGT